ncbi:homoserine O-succinyltransferase [Bacteroidia bacterium]|nr:homoserine O-succinyltransferase [Bacteroidia bacterium]
MPVRIPDNLPAARTLQEENIFIMTEARAMHQDIRPLRIAILNLMPTKIVTETQLLRLLGNSSLQVDVVFLKTATYHSKNTPSEHIDSFYTTFDAIKGQKFDGLVITGAPIEQIDYEDVYYWGELQAIMDWAQHNVYSTLYVCWGAQAGLYHHYGIRKYPLETKMFGVFAHRVVKPKSKLMRGFDDIVYVPHSRHTEVRLSDIQGNPELEVLSVSDEAGACIIQSQDRRHVFVTGHPEYDSDTLKREYDRDIERGLDIGVPANYFPHDDPSRAPIVRWRAHAHLLYANWLNYYVYQMTPFDLNTIE